MRPLTPERPEQSAGPVLALNHVTHSYGAGSTAVQALTDVSLSVDRGEVLLVVGPSGGGKTTALLMMGLLLTPTIGAVTIDGADVGALSKRERSDLRLTHLGYVFQDYNLLNSLTALENVAIPLRYSGVRKRAALDRAAEVLDSFGLSQRSAHRPTELSGGEKQRVAAARALSMNPTVVLADEPTANLDSATGQRVSAELVAAARRQNSAVVIVTHDPRLEAIADRVIHLEDGRVRHAESAI